LLSSNTLDVKSLVYLQLPADSIPLKRSAEEA